MAILSVEEPDLGAWAPRAKTLYREPEPVKKIYGAEAVKHYLVGAGTVKNLLKFAPRSRSQVAGAGNFFL